MHDTYFALLCVVGLQKGVQHMCSCSSSSNLACSERRAPFSAEAKQCEPKNSKWQ